MAGLNGRTEKRGYATSQRIRNGSKEIFCWMKTTGGMRKTRYRGVEGNHARGQMMAATYNLLRLAKLGLQAMAGSPPLQMVGA